MSHVFKIVVEVLFLTLGLGSLLYWGLRCAFNPEDARKTILNRTRSKLERSLVEKPGSVRGIRVLGIASLTMFTLIVTLYVLDLLV